MTGVRVLEFGHVAAAPFASLLLADLGADVLKIEPPAGDSMRSWPPIAGDTSEDRYSYNFAALNRNKRSVTADLKNEADHRDVLSLCHLADVVIENYRPGVLDRLGLGYERVACSHRGIVYCSISGFGRTGPYRDRGAFDVIVQAMSGLMSVTGEEDGPPVKCGIPVGDFVSALYAALTITAVLPGVGESGRSVHLDCSMLDSLLGISALQTSEYWGTGSAPKRLGGAHPRNAPYGIFKCRDGAVAIAAGTESLWQDFCRIMSLPELVEDERFSDQERRARNQVALTNAIDAVTGRCSKKELIERLQAAGIPSGPVNTFPQILKDPHLVERGLLQTVAIPVAGETPTIIYPVQISDHARADPLPPPLLGGDLRSALDVWQAATEVARA